MRTATIFLSLLIVFSACSTFYKIVYDKTGIIIPKDNPLEQAGERLIEDALDMPPNTIDLSE